jgi:hypothetical protein
MVLGAGDAPAKTIDQLLLMLGSRLDEREHQCGALLSQVKRIGRVVVVSSFRVHLADSSAHEVEAAALALLRPITKEIVVLRPSHLVGPGTRLDGWLRKLWFLYPVVPSRMKCCCLDRAELFAALDRELGEERSRKAGTYTLLGQQQPLRTMLENHRRASVWAALLVLLMNILRSLGTAWIAGKLFDVLAFFWPGLRVWNFDTLYPSSTAELCTLYNKYSYRNVKIVGYNNGIVHFGRRFPGKTIISTIRCGKVARLRDALITLDAGVTLRTAIDVASSHGQEFYVLPNYSYISVGTPLFVPIHGSATDYSTLGETIEEVLLFDPVLDRFRSARSSDPAFRQAFYNQESATLLLRVTYRLKEKSRYFQKHERLDNPTSGDILTCLADKSAANIEIRKAGAASRSIDVYRYYTDREGAAGAAEFPRDALGKIWDKIESNPLTATLFHRLMRRFGYHVELFLSPQEFVVFWNTHATLPISKIQLRVIRRDGMPHSPFKDHECISADLFMLRKHKDAFDAYVKENFHAVQFNPGKHSM